jgi:hypothetical protein
MKMHWCTGKINIAGQGFHLIVVNDIEPISWPEAQVLMALHGEENVYELKPCSISETSPVDEKNRLLGKYGHIVERVFPGRSPRMETLMPGENDNAPLADSEGHLVASNGQPPQPEPKPEPKPQPAPMPDEDEDEEIKAAALVAGGATFKPGKHTPPHKGA